MKTPAEKYERAKEVLARVIGFIESTSSKHDTYANAILAQCRDAMKDEDHEGA